MKTFIIKYTFEATATVDSDDDHEAKIIIANSLSVIAHATHVTDTRIKDWEVSTHAASTEMQENKE